MAQNKRHQQQARAVSDSHALPPPNRPPHSIIIRSVYYKQRRAGCLAGRLAGSQSRLLSGQVAKLTQYTHTHTHTQNPYTSFLLTALHGIRAIPLAVTAVSAVLLRQYFTNTATADRLLRCHRGQQRHSRLRLLPGTRWIQLTPLCVQLN